MRVLERLRGLRLDPARPTEIRGLVFRKPPELWVRYDRDGLAGPRPVATDAD
jgi:hypothetical protein